MLAVVGLYWLVFIWAWEPAYLTLTVDDSFYYLKTAANIAGGHGPTFDQINATNGFHPLWMLILTGLRVVAGNSDIADVTRLALSLQVVLAVLGTLLVSRFNPLSSTKFSGLMALLLVNFFAAKVLINGQESALQFFLLAVTLTYWWRFCSDSCSTRSAAIVGALAALCVLARLDAVFFAGPLLLLPLLLPPDSSIRLFEPVRVRATAIALIAFALVAAPYFVWNIVNFNHVMPVSGSIKLARGQGVSFGGMIILTVAAISIFVCWLYARRMQKRDERVYEIMRYLFPLFTYVAVETGYVAGIRGRAVPELWYLVPHLLLLVWLTVIVQRQLFRRPHGRLLFYAGVTAYCLGAALIWQARFQPSTYSDDTVRRQIGQWLNTNTSEQALIGSWNAGVLGAHSDRRVINLDGLINSWDYKQTYLDQGAVETYILHAQPFNYVADYQDMRRIGHVWGENEARFRGVDFSGWYVAHARYADFRSLSIFQQPKPLLHLVLSRQPCPTCTEKFEDFAPSTQSSVR